MQREIKFRAWDKEYKTWALDYEVYISLDGCLWEDSAKKFNTPNQEISWSNTGRYVLVQYTGLKDKNGKEIFEGDIVEYAPNDIFYKWQVLWGKRLARYYLLSLEKDIRPDSYLNEDIALNCEIIGNIYKNPELLREK